VALVGRFVELRNEAPQRMTLTLTTTTSTSSTTTTSTTWSWMTKYSTDVRHGFATSPQQTDNHRTRTARDCRG